MTSIEDLQNIDKVKHRPQKECLHLLLSIRNASIIQKMRDSTKSISSLPPEGGILKNTYGPVAQLARAPVLHSGGRWFESSQVHEDKKASTSVAFFVRVTERSHLRGCGLVENAGRMSRGTRVSTTAEACPARTYYSLQADLLACTVRYGRARPNVLFTTSELACMYPFSVRAGGTRYFVK